MLYRITLDEKYFIRNPFLRDSEALDFYVRGIERYFNYRLVVTKYVSMREVYEMLGVSAKGTKLEIYPRLGWEDDGSEPHIEVLIREESEVVELYLNPNTEF